MVKFSIIDVFSGCVLGSPVLALSESHAVSVWCSLNGYRINIKAVSRV